MLWDYNIERNDIDATLVQVQDSYLAPLSDAIWQLDETQSAHILKGIKNLNDVKLVKITTETGIQSYGEFTSGNDLSRSYEIRHYNPASEKTENIGHLQVIASLDRIYNRIWNRVLVVLLSNMLKSILVATIILLLFYKMVARHLVKISDFVDLTDISQPVKPLRLNRVHEPYGKYGDELDKVVEKVNSFIQGLDAAHTEHQRELEARLTAELKLQKMNVTLEDDIARRTETIVRQQSTIANLANLKSLSDMAGGVAHEINNPLAIIDGYCRHLQAYQEQTGNKDPKFENAINKIVVMVQRITNIIAGLRSFARDGGADPFKQTKASELIKETLSVCKERYIAEGIKIIEPQNQDLDFLVDCRITQIRQALLHLISNSKEAIQDSKDRWIKIEYLSENKFGKFIITDSGGPIPEDIQQKMLQPFFTTKAIGTASGLGLSISKGIIEDHGGIIYYDKGASTSCFGFKIPLEQENSIKYGDPSYEDAM
jgi:C4-dicarboxylate-specific signal transduction histidine kinase